jgi:hypothetical protein
MPEEIDYFRPRNLRRLNNQRSSCPLGSILAPHFLGASGRLSGTSLPGRAKGLSPKSIGKAVPMKEVSRSAVRYLESRAKQPRLPNRIEHDAENGTVTLKRS